jgi:hypothetical protein
VEQPFIVAIPKSLNAQPWVRCRQTPKEFKGSSIGDRTDADDQMDCAAFHQVDDFRVLEEAINTIHRGKREHCLTRNSAVSGFGYEIQKPYSTTLRILYQ